MRRFLYQACLAILATTKTDQTAGSSPHAFPTDRGLTKDVPFSPQEEKASVRLAAACADDAQIEKLSWVLPNETPAQAWAKERIHSLAIQWWAWNLEREVRAWLVTHGNHVRNRTVVSDCIW